MDSFLSDIVAALYDLRTTRYCAVAAGTLGIYDWLIVLQEEIELIGKARISLGKALYYTVSHAQLYCSIWLSIM